MAEPLSCQLLHPQGRHFRVTHLVTDEFPLLLIVILAQQLDLVWRQVHTVLGRQKTKTPESRTPPSSENPQTSLEDALPLILTGKQHCPVRKPGPLEVAHLPQGPRPELEGMGEGVGRLSHHPYHLPGTPSTRQEHAFLRDLQHL